MKEIEVESWMQMTHGGVENTMNFEEDQLLTTKERKEEDNGKGERMGLQMQNWDQEEIKSRNRERNIQGKDNGHKTKTCPLISMNSRLAKTSQSETALKNSLASPNQVLPWLQP
eukprot:m.204109 g.204109  ORF g.204109 m.204109 type:complete len:114 (+) comp39639_c0_seq31:1023-1364(+)